METDLTPEEKELVAALLKVAELWTDSVKIVCDPLQGRCLFLARVGSDGGVPTRDWSEQTFDPAAVIGRFHIPCEIGRSYEDSPIPYTGKDGHNNPTSHGPEQ